jgi:hypothetical protein
MLAIVQHQKYFFRLYMIQQGLKGRLFSRTGYVKRLSYELWQQRWIVKRGKFHQPNTIFKAVAHDAGNLHCEPCLAAATRASQGQEAHLHQ